MIAASARTLMVVSLFPHQVRPLGRREIAQARAVAYVLILKPAAGG